MKRRYKRTESRMAALMGPISPRRPRHRVLAWRSWRSGALILLCLIESISDLRFCTVAKDSAPHWRSPLDEDPATCSPLPRSHPILAHAVQLNTPLLVPRIISVCSQYLYSPSRLLLRLHRLFLASHRSPSHRPPQGPHFRSWQSPQSSGRSSTPLSAVVFTKASPWLARASAWSDRASLVLRTWVSAKTCRTSTKPRILSQPALARTLTCWDELLLSPLNSTRRVPAGKHFAPTPVGSALTSNTVQLGHLPGKRCSVSPRLQRPSKSTCIHSQYLRARIRLDLLRACRRCDYPSNL